MKKIKFRLKQNAGTHYIGSKRYDPGDEFELFDYQTKFIMDKLEYVNGPPEPEPDPEPIVKLCIVEADDGWDVINEETKEAINDNSLSLEEAKVLAGPDAKIHYAPEADADVVKAVHKGAGKYALIWEISGVQIVDKLYTRSEVSKVLSGIEDGTLSVEDLEG